VYQVIFLFIGYKKKVFVEKHPIFHAFLSGKNLLVIHHNGTIKLICTMPATLFLIPSLMGNDNAGLIPEVTKQAVSRLNLFIVENSKEARRFLKIINPLINQQEIEVREIAKHEKNPDWKFYLAPLLAGSDAGLISDCGCPAVADPGSGLIAAAHQKGILIKPLVGPSSILMALMASGFNGQSFVFHGYLPVEKDLLAEKLKQMEKDSRKYNQTQIFMETPYRNQSLLNVLLSILNDHTLLSVSCNLTCPDEWIKTLLVKKWKSLQEIPIHKKPCIFLIYSGV
jgi:16S rRNA (cytidine1402-2'-O)-methyltransferase